MEKTGTSKKTKKNMKNVEKIIEELADQDLKIRIKAKADAQKKVSKSPNSTNLAALEKATRVLDEFLALRKSSKLEPAFPNRLEAYRHLEKRGYKIGKSKFYQDCKAGIVEVLADGSVTESEIQRYISKAGLSDWAQKKQEQIIKKLKKETEKLSIEVNVKRKKYWPRKKVETEQALKAGALKAGLDQMYRHRARDIIRLVKGSLKHTQALTNFLIESTEDLFDGFARMDEIEVKWKQ